MGEILVDPWTVDDWILNVHINAVQHGWWETDREMPELLALVISEWAEALEEYRKGEGHIHYYAKRPVCDECTEDRAESETECRHLPCATGKPEGMVVELADGVIRLLDIMGRIGVRGDDDYTLEEMAVASGAQNVVIDFPERIQMLNVMTSGIGLQDSQEEDVELMLETASYALMCIALLGEDPEMIMLEKHLYNVGRPYRHGGKVI